RIQGIAGNANLLAITALVAIIVFAIRYAARAPRRPLLIAWIVLSLFLFYRAASATAVLCAVALLLVLATILLMRRAPLPGGRTKWYVLYAIVGIGGGILVWTFRESIFTLVGRESDLSYRETIWQIVLERANER